MQVLEEIKETARVMAEEEEEEESGAERIEEEKALSRDARDAEEEGHVEAEEAGEAAAAASPATTAFASLLAAVGTPAGTVASLGTTAGAKGAAVFNAAEVRQFLQDRWRAAVAQQAGLAALNFFLAVSCTLVTVVA